MTPDPAAPVGLDFDALRELVKARPTTWGKRKGGYVGDYQSWLITPQGTDRGGMHEDAADLILAAVNALPALLDLVSLHEDALRLILNQVARCPLCNAIITDAHPHREVHAENCPVRSLLPREPQT